MRVFTAVDSSTCATGRSRAGKGADLPALPRRTRNCMSSNDWFRSTTLSPAAELKSTTRIGALGRREHQRGDGHGSREEPLVGADRVEREPSPVRARDSR